MALMPVILGSLFSALALDAEESAFLQIINQYRVDNGLGPLSLSPTLTMAAELHSHDMADQDYFSHYSLDNRTPRDRAVDAGYDYPTVIGENIAAGYVTAPSVFEGWRNSPGHNQAMLYPSFEAIGIGRAYNASSYYGWYWTTDFGGYDDSGGPPPPPPPAVQVTSTTHPDQNAWYSEPDPDFQWNSVPGAEGYSFVLDQSSSTTPDTTIDSTSPGHYYSGLGDGIWHFHVRVKTAAGWGESTHYRIKIDCRSPPSPSVESPTHPDLGMDYADDSPELLWSAPSDMSGIAGYSYILDQDPLTDPDEACDTNSNAVGYYGLPDGVWYFHIRAVDSAGNCGPSSHFMIMIRFLPMVNFEAAPTSGFEPLLVSFRDLSSSRTGIVDWQWDFGDGSESAERDPIHIYTEDGDFTVTLTVRESDGDVTHESKIWYIHVDTPTPQKDEIDSISDFDPVLGADILGTYVDRDCYVDPRAPEDKYGHDVSLVVSSGGIVSYVSVGLALPADARILAARLGIYPSAMVLESSEIAATYSPDNSWTEESTCWSNKPVAEEHECNIRTIDPSTSLSYVSLDVTDPIQRALSKGRATFLIAMKSGTGDLVLSSREGPHRPLLVVQYALGEAHEVSLSSSEGTGVLPNLGQIVLGGKAHNLPSSLFIVEGSYHIQYSPGYEFGTWDANGSLSIANVSDMSTDVVVSGPGSLMVRGSIKNVTYVQDDGSPDYSIGRSKGGMVASSFSPMFAGNLTRVRIYIWRACTYTNNTALVHVLSVNGTELISPVPIDPKAPGWLEILIKEAVTMTDDFLVAVEYLNDNCPRIGVDDHSKGASMTRWSSTWRNYHQNIMIRCEIVNLQPPRRITRISLNFDGHDPVAGSVIGVEGALDPGISEAEVTFVLSSPSGRREQCILTTDPHGRFSTSFIPMEMGEWGVSAGWEGTSEYLSSQTATHLQVGKGSVSLICRVEPFASRFNDTIMVMGSVVPVPVPTTLQYRSNGGEWITISEVKPSDNLTFALAWTPPGVGTYELRAMWPGNDSLTGDATYAVLHLVRQAHSEITMDFDEATTRYGLRVTVSGHMSPPQSAPILLRFWKDVGWQDLAVTSSGIDGHFSYVWPVDFVGMVLVQASWEGNKDYKGTQSNGVILRSEKATSSMSCQAEPTMAEPDTSIIVQGRIVPPLEIPVRITVTPPEGTQTEMVSTTNVTGDYVATFDPDQLGEWRILASWNGNHVYEGCVSSQLSIEVEAPFLLAAFPVIVVLVLKRQVRAWQSTGL